MQKKDIQLVISFVNNFSESADSTFILTDAMMKAIEIVL